jgi:hypothetical protein
MTSDDKTGIAIVIGFLLLWFWQKGQAEVTLNQTCMFPDGTEIIVPLGSECPFDSNHGGQSEFTV